MAYQYILDVQGQSCLEIKCKLTTTLRKAEKYICNSVINLKDVIIYE